MGVEYYVIDKANKTFYELGKGGWYELHYDMNVFSDLEMLTLFILEDVYEGGQWYKLEVWLDMEDYITNRVAPDLFEAFGKTKKEDLVIVNDCGDDKVICKVKKYKCIGSRYYGNKESDEYKEAMIELNKHLEDTELNRKWYNPENYKQYIEWKQY